MIKQREASVENGAMVVRVKSTSDQRLLVPNVSWRTYETLLREFEDHHLRLTYDRGNLEIMSPSPEHERYKELIGLFLRILALELQVAIRGFGSTTFRREDLERGLEPDNCFYIHHEAVMRGKKRIDLMIDPPPDLAVEVDITSSSLDREDIYASLAVPEIWRFDGEYFRVYVRNDRGEYEERDHSPTFPQLPLVRVVEFLRDSEAMDETTLVRLLQAWIRAHLLAGQPNTAPPSAPP